MKRLKYKYVNSQMSSDDVLCGDKMLHISIKRVKNTYFTYEIKDSEYKTVVTAKKATTFARAKIKGKEKLKELGAIFFDEVRKKVVI